MLRALVELGDGDLQNRLKRRHPSLVTLGSYRPGVLRITVAAAKRATAKTQKRLGFTNE
jgi:hypothetical protein